MKYTIATASHIGRVRTGNEDAVYPTEDESTEGPAVVAVADGMGGHAAGEIASAIAISSASSLADGTAAARVEAAVVVQQPR